MDKIYRSTFFCMFLVVSSRSVATTELSPMSSSFAHELSAIKPSLELQVIDKLEHVSVPPRKLLLRIQNPKKNETIEPISLNVPRSGTGVEDLAKRLAAPGKAALFQDALLRRIKKIGSTPKLSVRVELESEDVELLNLEALGLEMAKQNHDVTVLSKNLIEDPNIWSEFRNQLSYFLSKEQLSKIIRKAKIGLDLKLSDDLLPPFAKKMAGKFIIFRGPNCFHSALAFFDQKMPRLPTINVKEEEGYHKAMINYDELWRVISNQFYEIDPQTSPVKYGDMLVFFAAPEQSFKIMNFKWIRHAAIYLFGPYTFSKGSKSPNTPYSIKTLAEEWSTWRDITPNLGVKIYRRQIMNSEIAMPKTRDDWIY